MSGWGASVRTSAVDVTVTVYGAGIAGLTAAHELVEHGFRVRVVESERALDSEGRPALAVGGLARSQFGRVPRLRRSGDLPAAPRRLDTHPLDGEVEIGFAPGMHHLDPCATARLDELAALAHGEFGAYRLRIDLGPAPDDLGARRGAAVRRHLVGSAGLPEERVPEEWMINGERRAHLLPDTVRVGIDAAVLPGEHGFRFFPSYYRHVFDTMRRIPLVDDDGRPTGRTVRDRVVSTPVQALVQRGQPIRMLRRTPSRSPALVMQELESLLALGYTRRDIAQFLVRVLRYMCTSSERRAAELGGMSWWQYLCGYDPHTRLCRYGYSEAFTRDVLHSTRVLAAFDAQWGDAHTNGDTYVQLFLNFLVERDRVDAVLDGPTSTAWFDPWRAHLARLGVTFHQGHLESLRLGDDGRVEALVRDAAGALQRDERSDYVVVATSADVAEEVSRALPDAGVPGRLRGFTTRVAASPHGEPAPVAEPRDPRRACGLAPWDRFQTLTGMQFFFAQADVKIARGHLYFLDAPWGLSAICSQQFWRVTPRPAREGFRSVLSVDIGDWRQPVPRGAEGAPAAADLPLDVVAAEVFQQLRESLAASAGTLPLPAWYHIDTNLVETPRPDGGVAVENRAPYLIPITGDWERRPGGEPWVPGEERPRVAESPPEPGVWQAAHGGYLVHHGGLVYAGTYMRTFTRMTTMESANESGRHAANAILDHVVATRLSSSGTADAPRPPTAAARGAPSGPVPAPATLPVSPLVEGPDEEGVCMPFATTPLGDYAAIWPMADYELPDLVPARQHDAEFLRRGLPHPWDLSGVETMLVLAAEGTEEASSWSNLLGRILEALVAGLTGSPGSIDDARGTIDGLRALRQHIEAMERSR